MEKFLQWVDLPALQYPCTKGRGPTHALRSDGPASATSLPRKALGMAIEEFSPE